jgi:hypothetical protein
VFYAFGAGRRRRLSYVLGTSVLALGMATSTAHAQCAPDPTVANGTTTCTGSDADGLVVTSSYSTVVIADGASTGQLRVNMPMSSSYYERQATLRVLGSVDGGAQSGILVQPGTAPANSYDYYGSRVALTVTAGGQVSGLYGVTVDATGTGYAPAVVTIDNAGTISGTSGIALLATRPELAGFTSIINRESGVLGAISGNIGTLTNAGTIDGGSLAAITMASAYNSSLRTSDWTNSGTIRSNSTAATLSSLRTSGYTLTNTGTIANSGTGAAIEGSSETYASVSIVNAAGGQITSGGSTAITTSNSLGLTNAGRIDGTVLAGSAQSYYGSTVDSTAGTINGDLIFGAGNDVLVARYTGAPSLSTGVTGTVDGGAGTDLVRIRVDTDTTINTSISLPTNFEQLEIATASGATTTIAGGFTNSGTLRVSGPGTFDNQGTIEAAGQALLSSGLSSSYPVIVNNGTIRTTSATLYKYAVEIGSGNGFTNNQTISAAGDGVSFSSQGQFVNAGSITSAGTGVSFSGGDFNNSGTIRSTGGTGLILTGSSGSYYERINTGVIEGASIGASLSADLTNTGTIRSAGTAVYLGSYGVLNNLAGGVITGGTEAIGGGLYPGFNRVVQNAGTINGDVNLAGNGSSYPYSNNNRYFALAGGVLNGNLTLGYGDYLVTELVNTGTGSFAGINGTVTATDSNLRYEVRSDATASYGAVSGFATIGYELFDNAALTLASSGGTAPPVTFAGTGTVDLTADIVTSKNAAIQTNSLISGGGFGGTSNALAITSRGNLTATHSDSTSYTFAAVSIGGADSFTNAGTITVLDQAATGYSSMIAVSGGNVVNSGTISVGGALGISDATSFTNTGTLTQLAGSAASTGVRDARSVTNSGTISVGGIAITNSEYSYYSTTITNAAGGTIASSSGTAIQVRGGTFTNAGAVQGTVDLGYQAPYYNGAPSRSYNTGIYIAAGGTIAGDLLFGRGDDLLLQRGDSLGVSGTIDGGDGNDIYGRSLSSSGTVALAMPELLNFESGLLEAVGKDTTITTTGSLAGDLYVTGTGSVINQGTVSGRLTSYLPYDLTDGATAVFATDTVLASLTNTGTIGVGVSAQVNAFANSGTITSGMYSGSTVWLTGPSLTFSNSGTIQSLATANSYSEATVALSAETGIQATNSGQISGLMGLSLGVEENASIAFTNSGSIAATSPSASVYDAPAIGVALSGSETGTSTLTNQAGGSITASGLNATAIWAGGTTVVLNNAGRIAATGTGATAIVAGSSSTITLTNTGTISGATLLNDGADLVDNAGSMGALSLGAGDDRVVLRDGAINPRIDGGEGEDRLEITGTANGATIALGDVANVEALRMSGGFATLAGTASFADVQLNGGRLVGLAGSTLTANSISVATGATFGSAGTVNGNIAVAGTLSPGASPGTMTVNGNVALAGTSTALFEVTPTISDKLVVNGTLSIANGATLQIVQTGNITPGTVLDLITATGGVSGSFSKLLTNGAGFGLFSQEGGRIRVMSTFVAAPDFGDRSLQSLDYINGVLLSGRASSALIAAAPQLLTSAGTSNAAAFVQITPQAYAATRQISIENGLTLADAARGQAFAPVGATPGLFSFATALGGTRTLAGDPTGGVARTTTNGYGFLAGIGFGDTTWSLGAFGGYLNSHQTLADLGARTTADGVVAGVHGRMRYRGIGLKATVAYDGAQANTRRVLPVGSATGRYDLRGWTGDASIDARLPMPGGWSLRPAIGATAIRTTRDATAEDGSSPFALTVAKRRGTAVFVDGGLTFAGAAQTGAAVAIRPYLTLGARYQLRGRVPYAVAGLAGGDIGLVGESATRAPLLATAKLGADIVLSPRLALFALLSGESGDADHRAAARGGVRLAF